MDDEGNCASKYSSYSIFHATSGIAGCAGLGDTEWGDDFSIEIYGTLAAATKEAFSATGFSIKYYDTTLGYSRCLL